MPFCPGNRLLLLIQRMRRQRAAAVRCGLLLVLLCGCEPAANRNDSASVEVWGWNIAAASLEALKPAFQERRPDVAVNITMSGTAMQSRFLLSLIAGVGAPDVSQLQLVDAPQFTPSGKLMDLTELAGAYAGQFTPSFWANCLHEGRLYAIPWDMGPCAVFYKRDIFARCGVDPDAIETWDDYIEAGKRIVAASGGRTFMLAASTAGLFDYFEILIQQTGGGLFDAEGRIMIRDPGNRRALEVLRAILDAGIAAPINAFSHEYYASFQSDKLATYPLAVWLGGSIKEYAPQTAGNWGVFRLPAPHPGGPRASNLGGSVLVIPEQSDRSEAAWAFIEHVLCTPEAQIAQYRNFDLFPCLMTVFDDPFFDEPDPFYAGQRVRRLFALDIEKIPTLTRTSDWNEARRYLMQSLSRWASQRLDHDAFLASLEGHMRRRFGRDVAPLPAAKSEGALHAH